MTAPLLTPADVRALVATDVADELIATFIAGATAAVAALAGPIGPVVEVRNGGSSIVLLERRAAAITSITEPVDQELAVDDWFLRSDHRSLDRLTTGTNPRRRWADPVVVVYETVDDLDERRAIVMKLVQLDLAGQPGVLGFSEGNWSIQFPNGESWGATRGDLLAQAPGPLWHFG